MTALMAALVSGCSKQPVTQLTGAITNQRTIAITSTTPPTLLTAEQATTLAIKLANEKAFSLKHEQPFNYPTSVSSVGWTNQLSPAKFETGRWIWNFNLFFDLLDGCYGKVELAPDGSTNSVYVQFWHAVSPP